MRRQLVVACGALVNELKALRELNRLTEIQIECLPASLHMRPERIPAELRSRLERAVAEFDSVLVGYADCGTAGEIDKLCNEFGVTRLDGAHCYEFFAGKQVFKDLHDSDPTVFYLTDFLARHFDRLVLDGLGISDHPELQDLYFGNYTRVVYLAQTHNPAIEAAAQAAATKLNLEFEVLHTGYGELSEQVVDFARPAA